MAEVRGRGRGRGATDPWWTRRELLARSTVAGATLLLPPSLAVSTTGCGDPPAGSREDAAGPPGPMPAAADGPPAGETSDDALSMPEAARAIARLDLDGVVRRLRDGTLTVAAALAAYDGRIAAIDVRGPKLRSVIELRPERAAEAARLDADRAAGRDVGALCGAPILIKDNIATRDGMQTTAGSLALVGAVPPREAFAVARLRKAGGFVFGKTNLSEWANIRAERSTGGWSGRGGQTRNPHALDRSPCGSSSGSGVAVAAGLCAGALGSETDGSIVCPASVNGIVGMKPTLGLVSRSGVIPISRSQDTLGPMTRTVRDAAWLLRAIAGVDPDDPTTEGAAEHVVDYVAALDADGLRGARIGVARDFFGQAPRVDAVIEGALDALRAAGARLVDVTGLMPPDDLVGAELVVLLCELREGVNTYLAQLEGDVAVRSLADVIRWNEANPERELPHFGQDLFLLAESAVGTRSAEYAAARALCLDWAREHAIDGPLDRLRLDAWVAPTGGPAWRIDYANGDTDGAACAFGPAVYGAPHITVPAGSIRGLPVGLSFVGRRFADASLLGLAYAFEQATQARVVPTYRRRVS